MKISKKSVLVLWSLFLTASLWLVVANEKVIPVDFDNVVQRIANVKIINGGGTGSATLKDIKGLVWIETTWNFILYRYSGNINNQNITGQYSSILWWEWNTINSNYSVVVAWSGNKIKGESDTILGWESNTINGSYSTIFGWESNTIRGDNSVIVWWKGNILSGQNAVVLWSQSSVTGQRSVVLWLNSRSEANDSFLWTDGENKPVLPTDDVFAVWANNWVVINTGKAHSFAQLTLWGSMFIFTGLNDDNIVCSGWIWWWVLKVMNTGWQMCLCSCDGKEWNSMFGKSKCMSACNTTIKPECGTLATRQGTPGDYYYEWTCLGWTVVQWTWAYLLDREWNLYWTCQTEDGVSVGCSVWSGQISW